jgi:hypothetical protein
MHWRGHDVGLSAREIADEIAPVAAEIMADTTGDYVPSLTFPLGYFEREVIERVEVIWGVRRVAVPHVFLTVDFNLDQFPPFADCVRRSLVSAVTPLLESSGRVCQDSTEGVVVLLGQESAVDSDHADNSIRIVREAPSLSSPKTSQNSDAVNTGDRFVSGIGARCCRHFICDNGSAESAPGQGERSLREPPRGRRTRNSH